MSGSLSCSQGHTLLSSSAGDEPAATMQGKDLSQGVLAAIPGWGDVRLLAPHAELKPHSRTSKLCTVSHTIIQLSS